MTAAGSFTGVGRPPFDPELATLFDLIGDSAAAMTPATLPTMRAVADSNTLGLEELRRGGAVEVRALTVPGHDGAPEQEAVLLRPAGADGPLPTLYHVHGGGFVLGNRFLGLDDVLDWVTEVGLAVVSVEYRLAPDHPHPVPVEDCYRGLVWAVDQAGALGLDPDRLVVLGKSAGGGLCAALALLARDRGGPAIAGQMLLSPMLDDRAAHPSSTMLDGEGVWDRTANATGWRALLGDAVGGPDVPAGAAPARAGDLAGLPPAFIDVGSVETFRDEDVDYAARLWRAGGAAELHVWPGAYHGFDGFMPAAGLSRAARAARLAWLRRLLDA